MFRGNQAVSLTRWNYPPDIRNRCINFSDEISGRKEPTDCYDIYQHCFTFIRYAELYVIGIR